MTLGPGALPAVARLFEEAAVPYAVIGAHAVNAWVEPHITADIDVTAQPDAAAMARLQRVLTAAGWSVTRKPGDRQPSGPDFVRFVSEDAVMTLEVQVAKTDLQRDVIRRAVVAEDAGCGSRRPRI